MKNSSRIIIGVSVLTLMLQSQLAFAQNTAGVTSGEPVPQTGGTTTTGTRSGTTTTGQTPGTTTGTTGTTGTRTQPTTGTTGTRNQPTGTTGGQTSTVPTPADIPVVPSITQETTTGNQNNSSLVCDQDKCVSSVRQAMGNEIIVMTILFLGSLAGGILWILALLMMKKGVVERESRRMDRQNRMHMKKVIAAEKMKTYDRYINTVMSLVNSLQHKKNPDQGTFKDFQETSVFINMHGSKHLRAMNEHIGKLIGAGKPLAGPDLLHLKSELSKTIKSDLMV